MKVLIFMHYKRDSIESPGVAILRSFIMENLIGSEVK